MLNIWMMTSSLRHLMLRLTMNLCFFQFRMHCSFHQVFIFPSLKILFDYFYNPLFFFDIKRQACLLSLRQSTHRFYMFLDCQQPTFMPSLLQHQPSMTHNIFHLLKSYLMAFTFFINKSDSLKRAINGAFASNG